MGQSLQKITPGGETKKERLGEIAKAYYNEHLSNVPQDFTSDVYKAISFAPQDITSDDFYRAICEVVEAINSDFGYTQFKVPNKKVLEDAFNKHHIVKGKLTKEEFQKILRDVITETGFTGIAVKDILLYIFGVPATALLIKQGVMPKAIPNAFFIPAVTSITAFVLSYLNKL